MGEIGLTSGTPESDQVIGPATAGHAPRPVTPGPLAATRPRPSANRRAVMLVAGVIVAHLVYVWTHPLPAAAMQWCSDILSLIAPAWAGYACFRAGRTNRHLADAWHVRRGWLLLALGMWSWALGQLIWSVYELGLGIDVPFPSTADIAFLAIVPFAIGGMLYLADLRAGGTRVLFDALIITGSVLYLSWATVLGPTVRDGGRPLELTVLLAYPVTDVVLIAMVFLLIGRGNQVDRRPLAVLGAGAVALACADSAYIYLTRDGLYGTGHPIDSAWFAGFLIIGLSGVLARRAARSGQRESAPLRPALPYVPFGLAVLCWIVVELNGHTGPFLSVLMIVLVILVGIRQLLTLRQNTILNQRLTETVNRLRDQEEQLLAHQQQLHHLAFHDPLTGLANRALLHERLDEAVTRQRHDGPALGVLYLDLDGFKRINDELGHAAGDALLVEVAQRISVRVRADDTVARLGGDEFAVVVQWLDRPGRVLALAARLVAALSEPVTVRGQVVRIGVSVGVATASGNRTGAQLLHDADIAMYQAKLRGKGTYVWFEDGTAEVGDVAAAAAAPTPIPC